MREFKNETKAQLADIKKEILSIKTEISELKQILFSKADTDRLTVLEKRVFNIEKHFKLSMP